MISIGQNYCLQILNQLHKKIMYLSQPPLLNNKKIQKLAPNNTRANLSSSLDLKRNQDPPQQLKYYQENLLLKESNQNNQQQNDNNINKTNIQVQQYRKVSLKLKQQSKIKKSNSQRIQSLQKKVTSLSLLNNLSQKASFRIKHRMTKIGQTSALIGYMNNLNQYRTHRQISKHQQLRQLCHSMRQSLIENKQMSNLIYEKQKQRQISEIKNKKKQLKMKHKRYLSELMQKNQKKAEQIRNSELILRQKLKRHQQYKQYLAKLNHSQKIQNQYRKYAQNRRYLKKLNQNISQEKQFFRKTQKLQGQNKKIQSFYLTGC